jgi:hypothetical protein
MRPKRRSARWLLASAWLVAAAAVSSPSWAQTSPSPEPRTEADLATARKAFADALHDEQERRYEAALEGFRRARDIRDAAAVEYRIGTCLEGLGRLAEALSAYDAAIRLSAGDTTAGDVATASRERTDALSKRVAHLTLTLSTHAPQGAEVRVDGRPWHGGDVVLDPGSHRVEATAPGAAPFQTDLSLTEGGRVSFTVALDPGAPPPTAPADSEARHVDASHGSTTLGWVGIGVGAALVAGSVVSFVARENDIRTADRLCPGGGCEGSINAQALSATNRARIEGPLGFALGAAGIAAAGVGVVLVLGSSRHATALSLVPTVGRTGAGFALGATL